MVSYFINRFCCVVRNYGIADGKCTDYWLLIAELVSVLLEYDSKAMSMMLSMGVGQSFHNSLSNGHGEFYYTSLVGASATQPQRPVKCTTLSELGSCWKTGKDVGEI